MSILSVTLLQNPNLNLAQLVKRSIKNKKNKNSNHVNLQVWLCFFFFGKFIELQLIEKNLTVQSQGTKKTKEKREAKTKTQRKCIHNFKKGVLRRRTYSSALNGNLKSLRTTIKTLDNTPNYPTVENTRWLHGHKNYAHAKYDI